MMTRKLFIQLFLIFHFSYFSSYCSAQGISINSSGNDPHPSAVLDISATDQGLLIPRMTTEERNSIINPAPYLTIINVSTTCLEIFYNGNWASLGCACPKPTYPVLNTATSVSQTSFTANWTPVAGSTGYFVDLSSNSNFSNFLVNNYPVGNTNTFNFTGLSCDQTYYYRVRAANECGTSLNSITNSQVMGACCPSSVTDIDNNTYSTVLLGTQCWMAESLRTTRSASGQSITRHCYNNNTSNCTTYGGLYTWTVMMNGASSSSSSPSGVQGICPTGWHIPSHDEWTTLERAICTSGNCETTFPYDTSTNGWRGTDEGGKLKQAGLSLWSSPNTGATNSSGITSVPGGFRSNTGTYHYIGSDCVFMSTSDYDGTTKWGRYVGSGEARVYRSNYNTTVSFSVRCLLD